MDKTRLILVGGFLGAGKTTLLWESAQRLIAQGRRVGLITNDQAPNLADTSLLSKQGYAVREVAGSCFCCNFPALIEAAESLRNDDRAEVILAEPVGSCTDLSATIMQPIKEKYGQSFSLAPLTVLIDPYRLHQLRTGLYGTLHPSAMYIIQKQLEEADWIVVNKVDQFPERGRKRIAEWVSATFPKRPMHWLSAQDGEGLDDWLDACATHENAGAHIPEVDYDTYAEGEAVLGWLNANGWIETSEGPNLHARKLSAAILEELRDTLSTRDAEVGHVKIVLSSGDKMVVGNVTQSRGEVSTRGNVGGAVAKLDFVLNARVQIEPVMLEAICRSTMQRACGPEATVVFDEVECIQPGRPVPTHRYGHVV